MSQLEILKELHRLELEFYTKYLEKSLTSEQAKNYVTEIYELRTYFFAVGR